MRFFSLKLKRFLSYLGQHDVFIEFVPFKIILNLKKYSAQNCLCPVWTHCKLWIDGNVIKPVNKEYFHIVIFLDHVKLAKLKMKAEMLRLFCHFLSYFMKTFLISRKIIKIFKHWPQDLRQIFQSSSLRLSRVKQDIHKSFGGLKLKFTRQ